MIVHAIPEAINRLCGLFLKMLISLDEILTQAIFNSLYCHLLAFWAFSTKVDQLNDSSGNLQKPIMVFASLSCLFYKKLNFE
jgi:hypothetical protein